MAKIEWRKLGYNQKQPNLKCDLRIDFSSYAGGIDRIGFDAAKKFLLTEEAFKTVTEFYYGMEGETGLCIELVDKSVLGKTFDDLSAAINKPKRVHPPGGIEIIVEGKKPRLLSPSH